MPCYLGRYLLTIVDHGGMDILAGIPGLDLLSTESGGELVYRVDLEGPTRLRAMVLDVGAVDIDLHWLDATGTATGCLLRNDTLTSGRFEAGTYYIVADTFVSGGDPRPGEYLLVLLECEPGDDTCDVAVE